MIIDTTYDVKTILGKFHYGTTSSSYKYISWLSIRKRISSTWHDKRWLTGVILKGYGTNMNVSKN